MDFVETALETTELSRKYEPKVKDKCLLDISISEWPPPPSTRTKSKGDKEEETYYTVSGLSSIRKKGTGSVGISILVTDKDGLPIDPDPDSGPINNGVDNAGHICEATIVEINEMVVLSLSEKSSIS